jgi:predicted metal-dependent hydrolase
LSIKIIKQHRKSISLSVEDENIVLKAPFWYSDSLIKEFILKHRNWIEKKEKKLQEQKDYYYLFGKRYKKTKGYEKLLKEEAKRYIISRTTYLADKFKVKFNNIKINSAKKRWGSCSSKKNLNFSYRCISLPKEVIDYIIIHELTHLTHMDHSKEFWSLVKKRAPEYKRLEQLLKEF